MTSSKKQRRVWSDDEKRAVVEEIKGGRTPYEVAQQFGINPSTVYYWQNTHGDAAEAAPSDETSKPKGKPKKAKPAARRDKKQPTPQAQIISLPPVSALKPHPRGLSYEQLVEENERLHAALQALLRSPSR